MAKTRVQDILDRHGPTVFPGVYDTLSAKLAARAGFPMAFISGYSVSATAIGEPDLGLLTQTEIVDRARRVCRSVEIPIIVDADTGYGNPLNVIRTVRELIDAGAAGCFLEDQQWPKKCGHMRGKRVIEREEYLDKIRAAVDTRAGCRFLYCRAHRRTGRRRPRRSDRARHRSPCRGCRRQLRRSAEFA